MEGHPGLIVRQLALGNTSFPLPNPLHLFPIRLDELIDPSPLGGESLAPPPLIGGHDPSFQPRLDLDGWCDKGLFRP